MRLVLVGLGVVGSGLAEQLSSRSKELRSRGLDFRIVAAADSRGSVEDKRGLDVAELLARKKRTGSVGEGDRGTAEMIRDADADVVVELTPGTTSGEPALSHMKAALRSSKSVVTANKMPLALHYGELLAEARRRSVRIMYGACVGGGLPVLEFGRTCAAAEPVERIDGVLNATTNFVLSEMEKGGDYARALKAAQDLGYAEPDPSFDVRGLDAACKIVILADHVMGKRFRLADVKPLTGIEGVSASRVSSARKRGKALRLVARAGSSPSVGPEEVSVQSPLAATGRSHAVVFHCRQSGDRTVTGSGAGSVTTSLGVLRDLISLAERKVD
ncbi:MAG TPA: homoserine dehydrogenase [Nitrososphaerales archaeon]|nr:homoserine dehydrogenase [Nitrososphaerales archaeon]